jgi:hypothetical protein
MSNQDIGAVDTTETGTDTANQAEATKTYTQKEMDDMAAKLKSSLTKKLLKPYEELGDPAELKALREEATRLKNEEAMKRGDFEKVLQEMASKKDNEIAMRDKVISEFKIDMPLINAAAQHKSVSPEQVKSLLKSYTRLNGDGEVEVLDTKGKVKYNSKGIAYSVDDLVKEFLDANPHFVQATPATTNSHSSHNVANGEKLDLSKLNMNNPADKARYVEYRKQMGIT